MDDKFALVRSKFCHKKDMLHRIRINRDTNDIMQLTSKFLKKRLEQNICKDNFKPVPQRLHLKEKTQLLE